MRIRSAATAALLALVLLAGCTPAPAGEPTEEPEATPAPTATTPATQAPTARAFAQPDRCADLLTADTAAAFAADGLELLGGPEGRYGQEYFAEPTPEERAGGISCVWGDEADVASTVIVSVAPVTTATRSGIVSALIAAGLNESQIEGAISYARIGDDVSSPAELHVIRADSWISVLEALGGESRFQHATELVDEVTAQVYVAR